MLLYRGENMDNWNKILKNGYIAPKERIFEIAFNYNGLMKYDGSATYGYSKLNAILGHQLDSNKFKTSGISTTSEFDIAKFYSLHNKTYSKGIILELDVNRIDLNKYEIINVSNYIKNPIKPHDNEFILKRHDNLNIPLDLFKIHDVFL